MKKEIGLPDEPDEDEERRAGVAPVGASAPVETRLTVAYPLSTIYDRNNLPDETVDSLVTNSGEGEYDKITVPLKVQDNGKMNSRPRFLTLRRWVTRHNTPRNKSMGQS